MFLDGLAFEVGEALRDGVHLLLYFGAKRGGGGCVVVAEALEIVLEGIAEGGYVADDLVAEDGCGGSAVLAGAAGFVGGEVGEFFGELGETRVLRGGRGFAEQQEDDCEEGDELEEDEGGGHSIFLRPQGITERGCECCENCGGFAWRIVVRLA